ncbi:MAG: CHAP domain-containing protein [Tumebacillaceae bacterium]
MRRLLAIVLLLAVATAVYIYVVPNPAPAPEEAVLEVADTGVITTLGDGLYSYKGVDTRHGPQCVELAERFYVTHYPGTFPQYNSGPGAFDIWEGVADGKDVGGWANHRQFFTAYDNGTTRPQVDDMLLYDRTRGDGWGHIAIIAEVHENAVVILEQNSRHNTRKVLPLVENRIIDRGVQGVIRLKDKSAQ